MRGCFAADIETILGPPQMAEAAADRAGQQTLARWREEFPNVPVIATLVCTDLASALIGESSGAAILVVGSSSQGRLRRLLCARSAEQSCTRRTVPSPSSVVTGRLRVG